MRRSPLSARGRAGALALLAAVGGGGCGEGDAAPPPAPVCEPYEPACTPIVNPVTFDALYTNVLAPSCAGTPGTCHTARASGGLDLSTVELAHANLSPRAGGGDVACSTLWARVASSDATRRMPPGRALSDAQLCAIGRWIEAGAPR